MSHLQELELKILKFLATKNPPVQNVEDKENFLSLADERTLIDTLYNLEKKGLVISGVNYGADGSYPMLSVDMVEITSYGLNVLSSGEFNHSVCNTRLNQLMYGAQYGNQ